MQNRLKYYRHILQIDSQKEYAEILGVSAWTINRWEKQLVQPDITSMYKVFLRLKTRIPDLHMEDLLSPD